MDRELNETLGRVEYQLENLNALLDKVLKRLESVDGNVAHLSSAIDTNSEIMEDSARALAERDSKQSPR